MKKVIFALLIFVSLSTYVYSFSSDSYPTQKEINKSSTEVPEVVLGNFNNMFPDATSVRWRVLTGAYDDAKQYLALFKIDNVKKTARYRPDGSYLGGS